MLLSLNKNKVLQTSNFQLATQLAPPKLVLREIQEVILEGWIFRGFSEQKNSCGGSLIRYLLLLLHLWARDSKAWLLGELGIVFVLLGGIQEEMRWR